MSRIIAIFHVIGLLLVVVFTAYSQSVNVIGYVKDKESKENLEGVVVYSNSLKPVLTNKFGFFQTSVDTTKETYVTFHLSGYHQEIVPVKFLVDTLTQVFLLFDNKILPEIVVNENTIYEQSRLSNNKYALNVLDVKKLPAFLGETDILKALQFVPGVHIGREGLSGLYVRGGSPDQNLFLLDDVPLFNVYHLGGLFSVFDPNAIKSLNLYKGGFPAEYGGRLSSVIDIRLKDGNKKRKKEIMDIGLLSTRYSLERPIKIDTSSILFSIRRCNLDLFSGLASYISSGGKFRAGYTYYDVNAKYHHRISLRDQISVSVYAGLDRLFLRQKDSEVSGTKKYQFKSKNLTDWSNLMGSMKWNHSFNNGLFSTLTIAYTKFLYVNSSEGSLIDTSNDSTAQNVLSRFRSSLSDIFIRNDFDFHLKGHSLKFGVIINSYAFEPVSILTKQQGISTEVIQNHVKSADVKALEVSGFIEDRFIVSGFDANVGIHAVSFNVNSIRYNSLQPRLLVSKEISDHGIINITFSKMTQFTHLLSNSGAGFPIDLWVPVTAKIKPSNSYSYSVGLTSTTPKLKGIVLKSDLFYKTFDNLIEFKEGASFFSGSNNNWEDNVALNGVGRSYGLELSMEKAIGNVNGSVSYTLSRNERRFAEIDNNAYFPYRYDRTHDISSKVEIQLKKNVSFSAAWFFNTGNAITLATSSYSIQTFDKKANPIYQVGFGNFDAHIYSSRNGYRAPAYHRLDVGFNFTKIKRRFTRTFQLGIYNAYNRYNPFFIYFDKGTTGETKLYKVSLFPILPSVSWTLAFN